MHPYTEGFFASRHEGVTGAADVLVPILTDLLRPSSVVDVGCGTGGWLRVFQDHRVQDVLGVDGDYVPLDQLRIDAERFVPHDLRYPLALDRTFDLVLSLETAEHLPAESAEPFVRSLAALGTAVVFSAAIPAHGGAHHLNEQWPAYWADLFRKVGYTPYDCIRPLLWADPRVRWWYAQNTILFVADADATLSATAASFDTTFREPTPPLVHPGAYLHQAEISSRLRGRLDGTVSVRASRVARRAGGRVLPDTTKRLIRRLTPA